MIKKLLQNQLLLRQLQAALLEVLEQDLERFEAYQKARVTFV